ncbi:hypothetical protein HAP41_0000019735 [Bradyrhizobium barranii subsp. apii]|uniref:Uncharacterized protein n=1 Tax=Bradyrhizobium barranii subsp. apii TaxID=2819348 RepID=A0A8T5VIX7_9BRAD|nr:hypothetical protein [Bradyrhizobium barranii]UPT90957.1 hypothetical protein HAP41_0000019735 [Bradyrhizobium barranii subsp. apii]UPT99877.1 hypothetical protein J4G48_0018375 [Bradyrhizobium barranii subsp. apii]
MPSGDVDETVERDELLPFEPLLFELRLFGLWLLELLLLELAFVFFAPVAARAFLVGANLYPTLFRK